MNKFTKFKIILNLLPCLICFEASQALTWTQKHKLVPSDRDSNMAFGIYEALLNVWSGGPNAIAVSDSFAIIGAPTYSPSNNNPGEIGAAYIYKLNTLGNWVQAQKLQASDPEQKARFGNSVAISGNYAIVGARFADIGLTAADSINASGAAYIFERNTSTGVWVQKQKLLGSRIDSMQYEGFGFAVSISGTYALVSEHGYYGIPGSAYIFERNSGTGVWEKKPRIVPSDPATDPNGDGDDFGCSVSIDGGDAVIGAYREYDDPWTNDAWFPGAAYHFQRDASGNWVQKQKLMDPNREHEASFGCSVSISGNNLLIGSTSITDATGADPFDYAGAAYMYERAGTSAGWTLKQKIIAPNRAELTVAGHGFGRTVSLSGDRAIIGKYKDRTDATEGNYLVGAGAAYVFERCSEGYWKSLQKIVPTVRDSLVNFGQGVAISGNYAFVSSYNNKDASEANPLIGSQSVYVFTGANTTICCPITASSFLPYEVCPGGSLNISVNGGYDSYSWSPSTALNTTTGATVTSSPTSTVTYKVVGVISGGCVDTAKIVVTQGGFVTITASSNSTVCMGTSTTLSVMGADIYTWYPSSGLSATQGASITASPTISTTYTVIGVNSCNSDTTSTMVTVIPGAIITAGSPATICSGTGSTVTLTASGGTSYTWSPSSTLSSKTGASVIATPVTSTTYSVTGMVGDCSSNLVSISVTVINPVTPTITYNSGTHVLTSSSFNSNQWYLNGTLIAGATSQTYLATQNGNYTVKMTDSYGCSATSTAFSVTNIGTGITELADPALILIYPNPVTNSINISLPDQLFSNHNVLFKVYDLTGKEIMSEVFSDTKSQDVITINNPLADGIYLYKITVSSVQTENNILNKRGTFIVLR